jgi:hypothetical protein
MYRHDFSDCAEMFPAMRNEHVATTAKTMMVAQMLPLRMNLLIAKAKTDKTNAMTEESNGLDMA